MLKLMRVLLGPFGKDIDVLGLEVTELSSTILRIRIYDPNNTRWEVPDVIVYNSSQITGKRLTKFSINGH